MIQKFSYDVISEKSFNDLSTRDKFKETLGKDLI